MPNWRYFQILITAGKLSLLNAVFLNLNYFLTLGSLNPQIKIFILIAIDNFVILLIFFRHNVLLDHFIIKS